MFVVYQPPSCVYWKSVCVRASGWRRMAERSIHPSSMICITIYRLYGKNKIKQDQDTQKRFNLKMDHKNTMELHSSLQVIFIQIPAYRWSGDLNKPQSSLLKSQCIMKQCKQNQNKCADTHGGIMWQFGSSSRARTPMDGFHSLKLQSSPQKVNRTAESQAYVQNSTGHFIFSFFDMRIV